MMFEQLRQPNEKFGLKKVLKENILNRSFVSLWQDKGLWSFEGRKDTLYVTTP